VGQVYDNFFLFSLSKAKAIFYFKSCKFSVKHFTFLFFQLIFLLQSQSFVLFGYSLLLLQNGKTIPAFHTKVVVVVLPDSFRGMGAWRNSTESQQSGHASRSGPEVKSGRSSAKDDALERLRCWTIQEEVS